MAAVSITVPDNQVTLEGTAGLGVEIAVPDNQVTLSGTGGIPIVITVPDNQVTLEGTGTCYPYLYIVDSLNHRIQVTDYYGNNKFTIGSYGAGNGQFNLPHAVATDGTYLYVTDSGNARIQKFTMKGVYVSQWGSVGTGEGEFNNPMGIGVDRDFVWVVDNGNNRFQVFDKIGTFVYALGEFGSGENQFNSPTECSIYDTYFEIDDTGNSRIVTYLKATEFENTAEMPVLEIEATGYICSIKADIELPVLELEATGHIDTVISADLELPALELEATGYLDNIMSADLELPALILESQMYLDTIMSADIELPALELEATGFNDNYGDADLILPVLELEAYGDVIPAILAYQGICLNPVNQALTEYTNYPFNSFCEFNGKFLGASSGGIFDLAGTNDNGTHIDAKIKTGDIDSYKGSETIPHVVKRGQMEAYLSYESEGNMVLVLHSDKDGDFEYTVDDERVKLGRGFKSRFYNLELRNEYGLSFELENIRLKATPINQRTR